MVINKNTPDFLSEWTRYERQIINTIKKEHGWRTHDEEVWKDITAECRKDCLIGYKNYDTTKYSIYTYFLNQSRNTYGQFVTSYYKTLWGSKRFSSLSKNVDSLLRAVQKEEDPRSILSFICRYYLKIKPDEIIKNGYADKSLHYIFKIAKEGTIKFLKKRYNTEFIENEIEDIFSSLWEKISPIAKEIFINTDTKREIYYTRKSKKLKSYFYNDDMKSRKKVEHVTLPIDDAEDENNENEHQYNEIFDYSSKSSDAILINEEYLNKKRDLLLFIVRNIKNPRQLYALLFKICSLTDKNFVQNNYYSLSFKKINDLFQSEFLSDTYLAKDQLENIFRELEYLIRPIEDKVFCENKKQLDLADWCHKAKRQIVLMLEKPTTAAAIALSSYFGYLMKQRTTH